MTDYAVPATPADVLRRYAKDCRWRAENERQQAAQHNAASNLWLEASDKAESEADLYDKWQPTPTTSEEP